MPALRLEVFDTVLTADGGTQPLVEVSAVEEAKITSYEQGYSAGWEDASAAQQGDHTRIRADLARSLQSLSFTFQDARGHVLQAIRPLILEMTNRLLPEVARQSLGPTVLDALMPLADQLADAPLTLVLNPAVRDRVEGLVAEATGLPMVIEEEPSLSEGQVYIRLGPKEQKVDLDRATSDITAAVRGFFNLPEKDTSNG
jgi:flagellar biosynthesis/type III secretory pathway protein FliH